MEATFFPVARIKRNKKSKHAHFLYLQVFHTSYWFLNRWLCTLFWQIIFLDNWVQDYLSPTLQPEFFTAVVKQSVKYLSKSSFASWGYCNFLQLLKVTKSWKQNRGCFCPDSLYSNSILLPKRKRETGMFLSKYPPLHCSHFLKSSFLQLEI